MTQIQPTQKSSKPSSADAVASTNQALLRTPLHKLLEDTSELSPEALRERITHLRSLRASPPVFKQQIESDEELGDEARPAPKEKGKRAKQEKELFDKYS